MQPRGGNKELVDKLLVAEFDPVKTYADLNLYLGIDFQRVTGIAGNPVEQAKTVRHFSSEIKKLSDVVMFFATFNMHEPIQLGDWLNGDNQDLWYADRMQSPLELTWKTISKQPVIGNGMQRVVRLAFEQGVIVENQLSHEAGARL